MNFELFLKYIPQLMEAKLPAAEAHRKMAPLERMENLSYPDQAAVQPKIAAVMMLLYPKKSQTHLVLIVRNSYKGVHSAQIAFPGGKFESQDPDYSHTALRETEEEVGVSRSKIKVLKALTALYIPPSNFIVHPFLGISKEEILFTPDPTEVAQIIEVPLVDFIHDSLLTETVMTTSYANEIKIPAYKIQNHIVWGATAMMLSELKEILKTVFES